MSLFRVVLHPASHNCPNDNSDAVFNWVHIRAIVSVGGYLELEDNTRVCFGYGCHLVVSP